MSKLNKLAKILLDFSTTVKEGEKLIIDTCVEAKPLVQILIKEATKRNVYVHVILHDDDYNQNLIINNTNNLPKFEEEIEQLDTKFSSMDAYIVIRANKNEFNSAGVTSEKMNKYALTSRKAIKTRLTKKWVLMSWPTHGLAQKAEMNFDDYYDFCLNSMVCDYEKMNHDLQPLKTLMQNTNKVKIVAPGTNLEFSIKDIDVEICGGKINIPDGEVYTAPVIDSVNGTITYNVNSSERGKTWNDVCLTFKNGKIVDATCSNQSNEELMEIFNSDEGASYVGEFSLGVNQNIKQPIGYTLYDEKIGGSFHFTPGNAYEHTDNTNRSSLHWDLVRILNKEFGGGQIYFDDVLIQNDGKFVLDVLKPLN